MVELYSPDKMVEISIFSFESQLAKNDGSKVVRHSTVAAIGGHPMHLTSFINVFISYAL